jgi:hypothetical protein
MLGSVVVLISELLGLNFVDRGGSNQMILRWIWSEPLLYMFSIYVYVVHHRMYNSMNSHIS